MHLQTFLSTCALALSANAMLVPSGSNPSLPPAKDAEFWDSAKNVMVAEKQKAINLECTGCPVAQKDEKSGALVWSESELKTVLPLGFVVDGKEIYMNGQKFYPPTQETLNHPLFVTQHIDGVESTEKIYNGKIPISTGVEVHPEMKVATVHMANAIKGENPFVKTPMRRLTFDILGLEEQVIRIDSVELWISETDEDLTIFGINTTPYAKHSTPEGDACTTVLCRVRASIREKLAQWRAAAAARYAAAKKGCMSQIQRICSSLRMPAPRPHHGMKEHYKVKGGVPKFSGDSTLAPGGKNHPHHKGPHAGGHRGPHRHHHHAHGAGHAVRVVGRFFRHVVLPIFIGVAAGMAVSGIGMLVGQAIVLLYLRSSRRNNGQYEAVDQSEAEARESFDELPKYEEAPVYEDAPAYEDEKKPADVQEQEQREN